MMKDSKDCQWLERGLLLSYDNKLRRPEQGALDLGVREGADRLLRRFRVLRGTGGGGFQRSVAPQDFQNLGMRDAVESSMQQHRFDFGALFRSAAFERMDYRHGRFAFAQIARHGLAQHVFRRGQVEDIIDNLKRHAEVMSVLAESGFLFGGGAGENRSQPHAD